MIDSIRSSAFDCAKVYELTDDGLQIRQGSNTLKWLGVAMLILFPIGSVATFLLTANGRLVPTWNLRLALLAVPVVLSGMAIPLFKKGRTRPYSPGSRPADFLPGRVD